MRSVVSAPKRQTESLDRLLNTLSSVAGVVRATIQTSSLTSTRLFFLARRTPNRVPGMFRFPFGKVRYVDAPSLWGIYTSVFLNRVYDIDGLGDAPYIIDCGGNIGLSTIWFKQRYPHAAITVFEADPSIASVLEENVRALALESIEVVRAAVSDTSGSVTFVPDGVESGRVTSGPGLTVEAVRLSERIHRPVDLLKLDIEGSEFGVIKDLSANGHIGLVKNIVCEVHGRFETQDVMAELWSALSRAGFRITVKEAGPAPSLPGPIDSTPFSSVHSGKFILHLYAWRP